MIEWRPAVSCKEQVNARVVSPRTPGAAHACPPLRTRTRMHTHTHAHTHLCCQVPHLWPLNLVLDPWPMGETFFWETKRGVLSYVIARPLTTAISVVANIAGERGVCVVCVLVCCGWCVCVCGGGGGGGWVARPPHPPPPHPST